MYWFRSGSPLGFIPWMITALVWSVGGWLIATHAFNTNQKERLVIGFGLGLVLYLWLVNLIGRWLSPMAAFIVPSLVVLAIGIFYSWKSKKPFLDFKDFSIYPLLIVIVILLIFSTLTERGLSIFDDYHHLPAISVIGAGSLPPKDYLNANFNYFYHYGFELLGGSLMQLGDLFAWSAFDISKAMIWVYSLILVGLVLNRYLNKTWKAIAGTIVFVFLGGTRYLLMLLPPSFLHLFDASTGFEGISANLGLPLSKVLFVPWNVGGGPPTPITFGFVNGINSPYIMSHGGEWPLALVIIFLIWLLSAHINSAKSIPILAMLMAHLALTFESSYGLILLAIVIIAMFSIIAKTKFDLKQFWYLAIASAISLPFAFLQGGTLFSIAQNLFFKSNITAAIVQTTGVYAFSFQWPPTIFSAHFGGLNIFSPFQLLLAIFEIGPILFFTPWITTWAVKKFKGGDWVTGVIIVSTWLAMILSIFVSYNLAERDITRFSKHAILFWLLIFILMILSSPAEFNRWSQRLAILCAVLMSIGGLVIFVDQLSALRISVLSEGIEGIDSHISSQVWGTLTQSGLIFDPGSNGWRATAITGVPTIAGPDYFTTPEWKELATNPSLAGFLENHFRYLYVDEQWWHSLTAVQQNSLSNPCIQIIAQFSQTGTNQYRKILDMNNCR